MLSQLITLSYLWLDGSSSTQRKNVRLRDSTHLLEELGSSGPQPKVETGWKVIVKLPILEPSSGYIIILPLKFEILPIQLGSSPGSHSQVCIIAVYLLDSKLAMRVTVSSIVPPNHPLSVPRSVRNVS